MVRAVLVLRVTRKFKQVCASLIQLSARLRNGAPNNGRETRPWAWTASLGTAWTLGEVLGHCCGHRNKWKRHSMKRFLGGDLYFTWV